MRPLSSAACLEVWERGESLHPIDQALLALSFALPEASPESLADWPLGRRNQALLELHGLCFGPAIEAWTTCEQCGEKLELSLDTRELLGERGQASSLDVLRRTVGVGGRDFRLPSSRDLAYLAAGGGPGSAEPALGVADSPEFASAAPRLAQRCAVDPLPVRPEDLPEIEQALAAADPLAEIRLALLCPTCVRAWEEPLDILTFLWAEIEGRARLLLWQIHTLASTYGWSESEVLALGETRRGLYLEMIQTLSEGAGPMAIPGRSPAAGRRALSVAGPAFGGRAATGLG